MSVRSPVRKNRRIELNAPPKSGNFLLLLDCGPKDIDQPSLSVKRVLAEHARFASDARQKVGGVFRNGIQLVFDFLDDVVDLFECSGGVRTAEEQGWA